MTALSWVKSFDNLKEKKSLDPGTVHIYVGLFQLLFQNGDVDHS